MRTGVLLTASFIGLHTNNVFLSLIIGVSILCVLVIQHKFENK
jgi:hypothetical protein